VGAWQLILSEPHKASFDGRFRRWGLDYHFFNFEGQTIGKYALTKSSSSRHWKPTPILTFGLEYFDETGQLGLRRRMDASLALRNAKADTFRKKFWLPNKFKVDS